MQLATTSRDRILGPDYPSLQSRVMQLQRRREENAARLAQEVGWHCVTKHAQCASKFLKSCLPQSMMCKLLFESSVAPNNPIMLDALDTQEAAFFQPKLNPRSLVLAERCRQREESTSQSKEESNSLPSNGESSCLVPKTLFSGQQHLRNNIPYPIITRRPRVRASDQPGIRAASGDFFAGAPAL